MISRKIKKYALLFLVLGLALVWFFNSTSGKYGRTYSPDRQYSVYSSIYHSDIFQMTMPGHSGDRRGKLFLYDEVKKKIIATGKINMINSTSDISWTKNSAYYRGEENYPNALNQWKLPREIKFPKPQTKLKETKILENDTKIIKEYFDNTKILKTEYKQGSFMGCGIVVEYLKDYYKNGLIQKESKIDNYASKHEDEGCHSIWTLEGFTEYFENGNLKTKGFKKYGYQSVECPCGIWKYYNSKGELIDTRLLGNCFDEKFDCE